MKSQPPKQQAFLVTLPSRRRRQQREGRRRSQHHAGKGSVAIDFYVPSLDGKLVGRVAF